VKDTATVSVNQVCFYDAIPKKESGRNQGVAASYSLERGAENIYFLRFPYR